MFFALTLVALVYYVAHITMVYMKNPKTLSSLQIRLLSYMCWKSPFYNGHNSIQQYHHPHHPHHPHHHKSAVRGFLLGCAIGDAVGAAG